jgi:phosphopantetheinyl transferase
MNPTRFDSGDPTSVSADVWALWGRGGGSDTRSRATEVEIGRVLGGYLDGTPPIVARDAAGKPFLRDVDGLSVSVAHAAHMTLVAISRDGDVGVDVEHRTRKGLRSLPAYALGEGERAELRRVPATVREEAFLTYWVRKEAILKAAGVGLGVEPNLIEVSPPWEAPSVRLVPERLGPAHAWVLLDLDLPGCAAAVAICHST